MTCKPKSRSVLNKFSRRPPERSRKWSARQVSEESASPFRRLAGPHARRDAWFRGNSLLLWQKRGVGDRAAARRYWVRQKQRRHLRGAAFAARQRGPRPGSADVRVL